MTDKEHKQTVESKQPNGESNRTFGSHCSKSAYKCRKDKNSYIHESKKDDGSKPINHYSIIKHKTATDSCRNDWKTRKSLNKNVNADKAFINASRNIIMKKRKNGRKPEREQMKTPVTHTRSNFKAERNPQTLDTLHSKAFFKSPLPNIHGICSTQGEEQTPN